MTPPERDLHAQVQELMVEIAVLKSRLEMGTTDATRALAIQAKEYERRLEELNNAHARAERVLGTYVTRESFDLATENILREQINFKAELQLWRTTVDKQLSLNEGRRALSASIFAFGISILSILLALGRYLWH